MSGKECFSDGYTEDTNYLDQLVPRFSLAKKSEISSKNFLKNIETISSGYDDNLIIRSKIAEVFLDIYKNSKRPAAELLNDFELIKDKFSKSLPKDINNIQNLDNSHINKRLPGVEETIEATLRRFSRLEKIEDIFKNHVKGIVVGGSMSYGPFYNIRENLDSTGSSDIDLIFIVNDDQLNSKWDFILDIPFYKEEDKINFIEREKYFLSFRKEGMADIFSKKFSLKDFDFEISIHVFPENIFLDMIDDKLSNDLSLNEDQCYLLRDYKDNHFPHKYCSQKSFSNRMYQFPIPKELDVENGNITTLLGYAINNGEFYPGIYQNLISPMFSVCLDNDRTKLTNKIVSFKENMIDRLNKERFKSYNDKFQFSHIRHNYFSPSLTNSLNKY